MQPVDDPDAFTSPATIDPTAAKRVGVVAVALLAVSALVFVGLKRAAPPPPPEVASNPLLVEGREVYLSRCVSCHGEKGRGDGPIARGLSGPPVGDLSDARWKHGDRPEDVLRVVREGVPETSMMGWGRVLGDEAARAVSAYVLFLGGREVPPSLSQP